MEPLQKVIEHSYGDINVLEDYFSHQQMSSLLVKPSEALVMTEASLRILLHMSHGGMRGAYVVVACLNEFASMDQVPPWVYFCSEVTELVDNCLCVVTDIKRDTGSWRKLCNVIMSISESGEPLISNIFNCCAKKFLSLLFSKNVGEYVKCTLLETVSSLCWTTDYIKITDTLKTLDVHLKLMAQSINKWSTDSLVSVYIILSKSLANKEEALKKAAVWFNKWPSLQLIFVKHFSDDFTRGFRYFSDEVALMKNRSPDTSVQAQTSNKELKKVHLKEVPPQKQHSSVSDSIQRLTESFNSGTPNNVTPKPKYSPLSIQHKGLSSKRQETKIGVCTDLMFPDSGCSKAFLKMTLLPNKAKQDKRRRIIPSAYTSCSPKGKTSFGRTSAQPTNAETPLNSRNRLTSRIPSLHSKKKLLTKFSDCYDFKVDDDDAQLNRNKLSTRNEWEYKLKQCEDAMKK